MRPASFDPEVLRSFVHGVELGSFARAAQQLNRSTSAVSAQLKKLEQQAGRPLVRKAGRGMVLTEAGELMLAYARRLLELNDEAAATVRGASLEGRVRLGLQEDFGESLLPAVLGRFARMHPRLRVEVRIARNAELMDGIGKARLDLALAWDADESAGAQAERVLRLPMRWIGPVEPQPHRLRRRGEPLPLALLEAPCLLRRVAIDALDRAGIAWRIAFTSASLAGTWAAVGAGLGVSVRTPLGLPPSVRAFGAREAGLPSLPMLGLSLYRAQAEPAPAVLQLQALLRQAIEGAPAT